MKNLLIVVLALFLCVGVVNAQEPTYGNVAYGGLFLNPNPGVTLGFGQQVVGNLLFGSLWAFESGYSTDSSIGGTLTTAYVIDGAVIANTLNAPVFSKLNFGVFLGVGADGFNTAEDNVKSLTYGFLERGGLIGIDVSERVGVSGFWKRRGNLEENAYLTNDLKGCYAYLRF